MRFMSLNQQHKEAALLLAAIQAIQPIPQQTFNLADRANAMAKFSSTVSRDDVPIFAFSERQFVMPG